MSQDSNINIFKFIYIYKYALDGSNLFVLSYVYDCVYWYTYDRLGKWFVNTLGNIFHVKFLGYAHWFMYNRISQLRDYLISVDQDRYGTYIIAKYLDTDTIKENTNDHKNNLTHGMIFTK